MEPKQINNNITEPRVSFENAKLLKEKGFDAPCLAWYNQNGDFAWNIFCTEEDRDYCCSSRDLLNAKPHPIKEDGDNCAAPTCALAIEWIRINFGLVVMRQFESGNICFSYIQGKNNLLLANWYTITQSDVRMPEEQALNAGIHYCLTKLI